MELLSIKLLSIIIIADFRKNAQPHQRQRIFVGEEQVHQSILRHAGDVPELCGRTG